tara:strand:- start:798 stop:959 length:162 start_codon:yes stop_codon:yes gene_type:complete
MATRDVVRRRWHFLVSDGGPSEVLRFGAHQHILRLGDDGLEVTRVYQQGKESG